MQIVKLGGSLITAKRTETKPGSEPQMIFRAKYTEQIARELSKIKTPLILVHGAGSFGHVKAHKFGLHKGYSGTAQKRMGAAQVSHDVRELNLKVIDMLGKAGLPCISIPPNVTITNKGGNIASINIDYYRNYLKQGLVPVSFGDIVLDSSAGLSVCSGDDIMFELSRAFKPERAVFVCDEDGVFDSDPRKNRNAKLINKLTPDLFRTLTGFSKPKKNAIDVTGGMYRKAEICLEISKLGTEGIILNGTKKGRLLKALRGEKVQGTYF